MPLYEFSCLKCRKQFELLIRKQADLTEAVCPDCGGRKIEKLFSVFATASGGADNAGSHGSGGHSCHSCSSGNCSSCH